jgi:ribose-phosphate pyrophosphokinase
MRVLNLVNQEKGDIRYKISKFPDGQQTIDLECGRAFVQGKDVKIISRISTFRDLEIIIAANQALREMAVSSVHLYVAYFLGARSDRKFQDGGVNYLKHVICPVINSQKFDSVIVLDPHSDVLEACLNNFEKIENHVIVKHALSNIDNKNDAQDRIILVSPDGGALKKIYGVAEEFQIPNIITAMKHRDIKTGKITHTEIPLSEPKYYKDMKFVIVDDICDGGRTFIELAKAIQNQVPDAKIYLVVTHGIFSAGFEELNKWFEKIYTTNSYSDHTESEQLLTFNVF